MKIIKNRPDDLTKVKKTFEDLKKSSVINVLAIDSILANAYLCWPHTTERLEFIDLVLDYRSMVTTLQSYETTS